MFLTCTWSVQKVLRILNFRGLRIFDFRFFGVMLVLIYADKFGHFECSVNFYSYFVWTCFDSSSIFASSVSGTRKSHRVPDLGSTVGAAT